MSFSPNLLGSVVHLYENLTKIFVRKIVLKCIWKGNKVRISKTISNEKNEVEGITLMNFKTYYRGTVIKTVILVQE